MLTDPDTYRVRKKRASGPADSHTEANSDP